MDGGGDNIFRYLGSTGTFYEIEILEYIKRLNIKPGVYVDVGAHIGNHTIFFNNECNSTKVYSFEPNNDVFDLLQLNCKLNVDDKEKCVLYKSAVTTENNVFIHKSDINSDVGMTQIFTQETAGAVKVASTGLDSAFKDVSNIVFLKIDVEGAELEVLKSAVDIVKKNNPVILIESFPEKFEKVNGLLRELNYDITKRFNSDPNLYLYKYRESE